MTLHKIALTLVLFPAVGLLSQTHNDIAEGGTLEFNDGNPSFEFDSASGPLHYVRSLDQALKVWNFRLTPEAFTTIEIFDPASIKLIEFLPFTAAEQETIRNTCNCDQKGCEACEGYHLGGGHIRKAQVTLLGEKSKRTVFTITLDDPLKRELLLWGFGGQIEPPNLQRSHVIYDLTNPNIKTVKAR